MNHGVFWEIPARDNCEGLKDQYADGKAARVWEFYIGDRNSRTLHYNRFLVDLLRSKKCKRVLDVACGTGVDSEMLLEQGFEVTSTDASDKMLKYALKKRWHRRKEQVFDNWVIEEANWLTLSDDIKEFVGDGYDAVICLGNSFSQLIDFAEDQADQKRALRNFEWCVRPGGLLIIDHRNYDYILDTGAAPSHSLFYNSPYTADMETIIIYRSGRPILFRIDSTLDISKARNGQKPQNEEQKDQLKKLNTIEDSTNYKFSLSSFPHRLHSFTAILNEVFPKRTRHTIYGDFKLLGEVQTPGYYIHVMEKVA